jgi:arsenite methyltransferase
MTNKNDEIKHQVQERYGERARQVSKLNILTIEMASSSANGTTNTSMDRSLGAYSNIYTSGNLTGMPIEAIASSAGCGNPTALAELKLGERVLDLGSGGGLDCFLAAKQVGPTGHVIGLDMTPDMLNLARKNAETLGISNVEFIEGFIENIPLPDGKVDVVISNCVVCLSPDKDAVASEAFRVLSPGGRIHISDIVALGPMPQELQDDLEQWSSCCSGAEEEHVYLDRLRSVGFTDIKIEYDGNIKPQGNGSPDIVSAKVVAYKT